MCVVQCHQKNKKERKKERKVFGASFAKVGMEGGEIRMKSPSKKIVLRNEGGKGRGRCGDRLGDTL